MRRTGLGVCASALVLLIGLRGDEAEARTLVIDNEKQLVTALMRPHRAGTRYRFGASMLAKGELEADWVTLRNNVLLKRLTWLRALSLRRSKVPSFGFLRHLTRLERLDLAQTRIRSLKPLARLRALRLLDLSATPVQSLKPLQGCGALSELRLGDTRVSDLSPLKGRFLHRLALGRSGMKRLPRLGDLAGVDTLIITEGAASLELLPLLKLHLTALVLDDSRVTGIAPLSGHPHLRTLSLRRTMVSLPAIRALLAKNRHLRIITPKGRAVGQVVVWVKVAPRISQYPCLTDTGSCPREYFGPQRRPVYRWIDP
ncbi:MAG: hypothetical protein ABI333_22170 [bacterium]